MENFRPINYHETRDFSKKMSVTFEFIRQNFKGLSKSILFIAGPPVLVASLFMGSFMGDMFNASFKAGTGAPVDFTNLFGTTTFWLQIAIMFVFIIVSTVATIATINNYILLYEEKGSNRIEVNEVWERVRNTFGMYLSSAMLFTLLGVVVYTAMIIPVVFLGKASPIFVFFGVFGFIIFIIYLVIATSLLFIVRAYERTGFFEALTRSFKLVQGKWWSTFGIIMVLYLIAGTVSYVFMIPWYAMMIVSGLHNTGVEGFQEPGTVFQTLTLVFFTLYYLAQMILYTMPNVGIAFQYFNLVERKEARGLMGQIDSIGKSSVTATSHDEHY